MTRRRVVVAGGGIAGLTCAYRLMGTGADVTVLEAGPKAGGHARTLREAGYLVELGPNGFLWRDDEPEPAALVRDLGLAPRLIEARPAAKRRLIAYGGRLRALPESPSALLASDALTPAGKLRLAMEPWARRARAGVEETVFEFAERRIGREAAERLVDTAVSGTLAGDSRTLSVSAAFPRMVEMEREHGSLIRAMIAGRGRMDRLVTFDGGMRTLTHALAARLRARVRVHTGARALLPRPRGWRVAMVGGGSLEADEVVLAVPARRAAELLEPLDPALAHGLASVPTAGLAMVALAYEACDLARPPEGCGFLVARSEARDTLAVVWESTLFDGRAPAGTVLLRCMLGGPRRPELVQLDHAELVRRARLDLGHYLGISAPPRHAWVMRWPRAIAQYTRGHDERVAGMRCAVAGLPGLTLCGSSYDGISFTSAITSGAQAAARLAGVSRSEPLAASA